MSSFRAAARIARSVAGRPVPAGRNAAPLGRRMASSSAGAKQSSDMPWMAGSAVIFGGLGAYIMTSGNKPKDAHAAHETIGSKNHPTPSEKGEDEGPKTTEKAVKSEDGGVERAESKAGGEDPSQGQEGDSKGEKEAIERSMKTDAPKAAAAEGDKKPDSEAGSDDNGDADEGRKAEDIPEEEIKKAIERGEKTDAPKVAMAEEAQGHQTQAELDKK